MAEWIDAHTHLDADELYEQKARVLDRAAEAGVKKVLLVNSEATEESFRRTQDCLAVESLVERFASFGIHPHHARLYGTGLEDQLLTFLNHPRVIAFGEIGLDFFYNNSPQDVQILVLQKQLRLALGKKLPVVIHCRDAYGKLEEILHAETCEWRGMIHCFTGTPEEAERLMKLGFYISFSGIVTFRNANVLRDSLRVVPLNRILIETDAPFLAPMPHRGKTNEPAFVVETGRFLAELKQVSEQEFSHHIARNFTELFGV